MKKTRQQILQLPQACPLKNKPKLRSIRNHSLIIGFCLTILSLISTITARAIESVGTQNNCWFNNGGTKSVKIEIDPAYFKAMAKNIAPNTVQYELQLYSGCPSGTPVGSPIPAYSTSGNVLLFNVGTLPAPYYFNIVQKHYAPGSITPYATLAWASPALVDCPKYTIDITAECPCPEVMPYHPITGCWYTKEIDGMITYLLDIKVTGAAQFYLACHGYHIGRAYVSKPGSGTFTFLTPLKAIGDTYTFRLWLLSLLPLIA
jgi:hypothetical protein